MRLDLFNHRLHPLHHLSKVELSASRFETERLRPPRQCQKTCRADQRLGGDTAGIEAVTTHLMLLDQAHLGLDRRSDIGRDQPTGTGTDHYHIAVK